MSTTKQPRPLPDKSEIAERAARFWSSFTPFFKVGPDLEIAVALATAAMRTESRRVLIETLTRVSGNELDLNVLIEHLILRKGMFHEENNTFGFSRSGGSGFDDGNGTFAGRGRRTDRGRPWIRILWRRILWRIL